MSEKKNAITDELLRKSSKFLDLLKKGNDDNIKDFIDSKLNFI
jgi:hypothetical protein